MEFCRVAAMSDRWDVARVVADCDRYWRQTGVPRRALAEMRIELEQHLLQAAAEGRPVESVIGGDLPGFAEAWAGEHRERPTQVSWDDIAGGEPERRKRAKRELILYSIAIAALVAAVGLEARGGVTMEDLQVWRWLWTGLAVVMGIGEIFTAGFFLLPFAIGAGAAAILAWIGVGLLSQWLVFFAVSFISLAYLRRFIRRQDEGGQPQVGANRWVNTQGLVLEDVDSQAATGMVRIEGEQWRATTDGEPIGAGTKVVVKEVRGARLVVSPAEDI
jgi:inner membrane protein